LREWPAKARKAASIQLNPKDAGEEKFWLLSCHHLVWLSPKNLSEMAAVWSRLRAASQETRKETEIHVEARQYAPDSETHHHP